MSFDSKLKSKNSALFESSIKKERAIKVADKTYRETLSKIRKEYDDEVEAIESSFK